MSTSIWKTRLYRIGALTAVILATGGLFAFFAGAQSDSSTTQPSGSETIPPGAPSAATQHPLQSQPAPDFALEQMNGETFTLSEHRGKVVVVNFWATWCPPCRMEIPGFIKLQEELGDQGLTFVGISLDEDGFESVRPYAEEMGINYPLVVGGPEVMRKYGGVRALPTSFVVAPDGEIAFARPGYLPEGELRTRLAPLLEQATGTASERAGF